MKDLQIKWLMRITILLLGLLTIFVFYKLHDIWNPFYIMIKAIFVPFFISCFITYLLHPVVEKLHRTGLPRTIAILIIYSLFLGLIGYVFYRGIPLLVTQLRDLAENIPHFSSTYNHWIQFIHEQTDHWPDGISERIDVMFEQAEEWLAITVEAIIESLKSIFDYLLLLAIIPFLVFYMLKDYDQIKKAAWYMTPRKWRTEAIGFLKDINYSLGNYIRGQLFVCILIGALASLLLWFFKIKYPLILGVIIGATNVIPYFGPVIGAIPALIIAATMSAKTVMIIIAIIFFLQFIEGNVLGPLVVGKTLHMHPIFIMLALLAGGEIGGVIGLMLAVPLIVVLKVFIVHLVQLKRQH